MADRRVMAVSYTHLSLLPAWQGHPPHPFLLPGKMDKPVPALPSHHQCCNFLRQPWIPDAGPVPVSYTHLDVYKRQDIEGLKKIAAVIHNNDTPVFAQISHAGGATQTAITGCRLLSASSIQIPGIKTHDMLPSEMTQRDIDKVVNDFAKAALRVKKAGFDGVEIHSAHGYLLNQFFSPLTNKRLDQYTGNTLQGRIRLHLEIIRAVRKQ